MVSVKIGGIDLVVRHGDDSQGEITEIRSIKSLLIGGKRRLAECRLVSDYGSIILDNGRQAVRMLIEGEFVGQDAKQSMTLLRSKYKTGKPLQFAADITVLTHIEKVLIGELHIYGKSTLPTWYSYNMLLVEYREPAESNRKEVGEVAAPSGLTDLAIQEVESEAKGAAQAAEKQVESEAKGAAQAAEKQVESEAKGAAQAAEKQVESEEPP
jgi:hypothetical protein